MRKVVGASSYGRQLRPRRTLCRSFLLLRRSNKFSDRSSDTTDNFIELIGPSRRTRHVYARIKHG